MCRFCDELKSTGHAQLVIAHHIQQLAVMLGEFPEDVVAEALQLVIQIYQ